LHCVKAAEEAEAREADVAPVSQQPKDQRDKKLALPKSGAFKSRQKRRNS
jgi:hypothetical protein